MLSLLSETTKHSCKLKCSDSIFTSHHVFTSNVLDIMLPYAFGDIVLLAIHLFSYSVYSAFSVLVVVCVMIRPWFIVDLHLNVLCAISHHNKLKTIDSPYRNP